MAPICRAIEHKVRWSHHGVLSKTRGGSVATWVSNSNTERVDYQQYAFVDSKRSGSSLGWYVRYAWYLTTDMPCVKQSNRMPMDVYSWSWLKNNQIQVRWSRIHLNKMFINSKGHSVNICWIQIWKKNEKIPPRWDLPCIINLNARSLNTEKIDELQVIASNLNVSIICVTETWLKNYIADESVSINGFCCERRNRVNRQTGGVECYVKNDVLYSRIV